MHSVTYNYVVLPPTTEHTAAASSRTERVVPPRVAGICVPTATARGSVRCSRIRSPDGDVHTASIPFPKSHLEREKTKREKGHCSWLAGAHVQRMHCLAGWFVLHCVFTLHTCGFFCSFFLRRSRLGERERERFLERFVSFSFDD